MNFNTTSAAHQAALAQLQAALIALGGPNAPRALLVSPGFDGEAIHVQEVRNGKSLVCLDNDELFDHLDDRPVNDAWLEKLRTYCVARLAARSEARATGGVACAVPGGWEIRHAPGFFSLQVVEEN